MKISFYNEAYLDFCNWAIVDKNVFKKIVQLIKEIKRHPFEGMGKPEPLKGNLSGYWSRRITEEHRIVYSYQKEEITIIACKGHY